MEYSRLGNVVKGQEKAIAKSRYEEDVYINNHTVRTLTIHTMIIMSPVLSLGHFHMQEGLNAIKICNYRKLCGQAQFFHTNHSAGHVNIFYYFYRACGGHIGKMVTGVTPVVIH